jgi:hypothetical protein
MRIPGLLRPALTVAVLVGVAACGARGAAGPPGPSTASAVPAAKGLVLRVESTGGFVSPSVTTGRLPLVSVYADGRVISEGPVIAIYPGPALPNLQVQRIDRTAVQDLVDQAMAAGVADTSDLGTPPIADATATRITVVTASHTYVREAYALTETQSENTGLTEAQQTARTKLSSLVSAITEPASDRSAAYRPDSIAALATPWVDPQDGLTQPDVAWPGPALPGEPTGGLPGLGCVTVTDGQVPALLAAAASANTETAWVTPDGSRWSVTFRPLLPDESGCADLSD